jgi:tetratricopeptide (TPR) repeat protein
MHPLPASIYCVIGRVALAGLLLAGATAQAQPRSVFGGNAKALECYRNAMLAGTEAGVSSRMLEPCTYALDHISLEPKDRAATYTNRGVLRVALGRFTQALADYDASMSLLPEAGENYINRGNVHYRMGEFRNAIADYSRAVELDISQKHVAYFDRAMARERTGETALAEADYRSALALLPGWQPAANRLANLLARQQEADAAAQRDQ